MNLKDQIAVISFLLFSVTGSAQSTSGIYLNISDYNNQKLTYEIDCSVEKHKIKLNEFFNKPYITVIHHGEKYTLQKKEIYGFKDCNNRIYRFYKNNEYELAETGKIIIYTTEQNVTKGKGFSIIHVYYFSTSPGGEISPLTVNNLKNAFPKNHRFHDLLDQYFNGNNEISEYDAFHKMYKVNHLLEASIEH